MKHSDKTPRAPETAPVETAKPAAPAPDASAKEAAKPAQPVTLVYNPPAVQDAKGKDTDEHVGRVFQGLPAGMKPGQVVKVEAKLVPALMRSGFFKKEGSDVQ